MPPVPALSGQFERARKGALVAAQSRLVAIAKSRHLAVMSRDPRPSTFLRIVDGRVGELEETVKAAGIIIYLYERAQIGYERDPAKTIARFQRVIDFAIETLRAHSPVGSGRDKHPGQYRDHHRLYVNGRAAQGLAAWKPGDEVRIVNALEYSRMIEVGAMRMRISGTDHVYQQAQQVIQAFYGEQVDVKFTFTNVEGERISPDRGVRGSNRFPSLVITPVADLLSDRFVRASNIASTAVSALTAAHAATQLGAAILRQLPSGARPPLLTGQ